jgi:Putative zinc-finger
MGWMQITCREAARLMSARRDEPLGRWRQWALKLHVQVCGDCREVERQLEQMRRLAAELLDGGDGTRPPRR